LSDFTGIPHDDDVDVGKKYRKRNGLATTTKAPSSSSALAQPGN
jgi:hypothetical protein